jgi:hypothetical protein
MKITRGRTVRVNLGNYEHVETSASVEEEWGWDRVSDPEGLDREVKAMDKCLDKLLEEDLRDAESSTSLDDDKSFIYTWNSLR